MAMVSSTDFVRASERPTAIATLNRQRHLTPSCGGAGREQEIQHVESPPDSRGCRRERRLVVAADGELEFGKELELVLPHEVRGNLSAAGHVFQDSSSSENVEALFDAGPHNRAPFSRPSSL